MNGQVAGLFMYGWMNGWTDGRMDGVMDGLLASVYIPCKW